MCTASHDSFVFLFLVLGPAHQSPVIAFKASFSHPAGIDVLMIQSFEKRKLPLSVTKETLAFDSLKVYTHFKGINLLAL